MFCEELKKFAAEIKIELDSRMERKNKFDGDNRAERIYFETFNRFAYDF